MNDYFQEAYYGKSETLIKAEKVLGLLMNEIKKNELADYTNHKLTKIFSSLLIKQFGFKDVIIHWKINTGMMDGCTPINVSLVTRPFAKLEKMDGRKGFYNKKHNHVVYLIFSTNMVTEFNLTPSEAMAIILHELGHNFDRGIYAAVTIAFQYFTVITGLVKSVKKYKTIKNNISKIQQRNDIIKKSAKLGVNTALTTNKGKQISGAVIRKIEDIENRLPKIRQVILLFKKFISWFTLGTEIIGAPVVLLSLPVSLLISPYFNIKTATTRKMEEFADSFATAYGYGANIGSGLSKLDTMNTPLKKFKNQTGITKTLTDLVMAERFIVNVCFDGSHGTTTTRIKSSIDMLKSDLNRADYPPEVKKEIKQRINEMETTWYNYNQINEEEGRGKITIWVMDFINDLFDDRTDYIAKIFPPHTVEDR